MEGDETRRSPTLKALVHILKSSDFLLILPLSSLTVHKDFSLITVFVMISNQVQVDPWSWIIVYNFNCTTHITISYLLLVSYHNVRIFIACMLKWNIRDYTGTQCPYIAIYICDC